MKGAVTFHYLGSNRKRSLRADWLLRGENLKDHALLQVHTYEQ